MVEVRGLSVKQVDKRADRMVSVVNAEMRNVVRKATADLGKVVVADASSEAVSVDDINSIKTLWQAVVEGRLLAIIAAALFSSSGAVAESINRALGRPVAAPIGEDAVTELILSNARNRLVGIGDELWEDARDALLEGLEEGESIPKLADRVKGAAEVTQPRATVIARTEVIGATNAGSIATMRATDLVTMKQWLATPDARTRPAHRAANGQKVPLDEPFMLGGEVDDDGNVVVEGVPLDHPGDLTAPYPAQVIQCRCTMLYDVQEVEIGPEPEEDDDLLASADSEGEVTDLEPGGTLAASEHLEAFTMPWHIERNHESCSTDKPWAVVNSNDNSFDSDYADRELAVKRIQTLSVQAAESTECPPGHHRMPGGDCMPDSEMKSETDTEYEGTVKVKGVATLEGNWTGDGRNFAEGSLTWPEPAESSVPLQWQKETSHGGSNDVTVNVGWLTSLERDGNAIRVNGVLDTDSEDGAEAFRFLTKRKRFGVSIVADDPEQADMELVMPEGCDEPMEDDPESMSPRCMMPNVIYHSGRIRALTLVDVPAFVEAYIELADEGLTASAFGVVGSHDTGTSDDPWDADANVGRLDSPMPVDRARNMYAWIDTERVEDGTIVKDACKFPHHEVNEDGTPGAANLTACSAGIGALHGARATPDIPSEDRRGVYDHLAAHLRDGDMEPPPFESDDEDEMTASSHAIEIPDTPPAEWFTEPAFLPEVGAIAVTDEGRVYGLLAPRNVAHRSFPGKRVTVPMGNVDYGRWMNRQTIVAGGDRVATGPITMNCGHAETNVGVDAQASRDHYDNSCSVVATVRIGENRHGVWVAGALLPDVTPAQVARMMALQLSGDWRPHPEKPGKREMCGALLVPVPAFPRSASVRVDKGQLVASAVPMVWETDTNIPKEIKMNEESEVTNGSEEQEDVSETITAGSEVDLPSWDDVVNNRNLRSKANELAAKLGIEV